MDELEPRADGDRVALAHLTVALGQAKEELEAALVKAGDNRAELEAFISTAEKTHSDLGQRAAEFLVEGMPERDLTSLNRQFLNESLDLAMKAREEFSWCAQLPEALFFNEVLPYASLDETRERGRPDFYKKCRAIVAKSSTATEAVQALNSNCRGNRVRRIGLQLDEREHATIERRPFVGELDHHIQSGCASGCFGNLIFR